MESIELICEGMRCSVVPQLGGCIAALSLDGVPVLRSVAGRELSKARNSGCYALVPFSNRIAQATLQWQGTLYPLVQNNAPEPHTIHGVGWQHPWEVLDKDARSAMLAYEHKADASWPFAFDTSQTFRLGPRTLELTLSATNQSATAAPIGLGWHPFFVKRARSRIAFEATGRWEMGGDKLPTHRQPAHGLDADCAFLDVDHCFDGWSGVVQLRDELLHTTVRANLSRLVVFTNDTRDFVAIEPVSHVNNAMNLADETRAGESAEALGIRILQPGETMTAQMSIEVENVK